MKLDLRDELPFVTIAVAYGGRSAEVPSVLVDIGAARTILSTDVLEPLGLVLRDDDLLHNVRGVGGVEVVFRRWLDHLQLGERGVGQFQVEVGAMNYGFDMNGILGMDFLRRIGAVLDLHHLTLDFAAGAPAPRS